MKDKTILTAVHLQFTRIPLYRQMETGVKYVRKHDTPQYATDYSTSEQIPK
jgi:hypothetical protein